MVLNCMIEVVTNGQVCESRRQSRERMVKQLVVFERNVFQGGRKVVDGRIVPCSKGKMGN